MLKKGKAQSDQKVPRVMLAAHMDEIGLIITKGLKRKDSSVSAQLEASINESYWARK